jgi:hypothetical protein
VLGNTVDELMICAGEFALLRRLILSFEKRNCERPYCGGGQYASKPVMPMQASINTANNAAYTNTCSGDNSDHAFDIYERIDTTLFFAARLGFYLRLLEYPVDAIWANRMQTLNARDGQQRRIRVVVLHNHLGTATSFNVCCGLSTHVVTVCSDRAQWSRNHRASDWHPLQTHAGQVGSGVSQAQYPAHWMPRAGGFSDERPFDHHSRLLVTLGSVLNQANSRMPNGSEAE